MRHLVNETKTSAVYDYVRHRGKVTVYELTEIKFDQGYNVGRIPNQTMYSILSKAVKDGVMTRVGRGIYKWVKPKVLFRPDLRVVNIDIVVETIDLAVFKDGELAIIHPKDGDCREILMFEATRINSTRELTKDEIVETVKFK